MPWLELKTTEWQRQHFSQLEKMCRTRGLRSATSHLEATPTLTLEEARRDWLVDRLIAFEVHWHQREQTRPRDGRRRSEDIDGVECDIDGSPLDESDLDGEPLDIVDPGELLRAVEKARRRASPGLGGALMVKTLQSPAPVVPPAPSRDACERVPSFDSGQTSTHDTRDIENSKDPASLEPGDEVSSELPVSATSASKLDRGLLRTIELEVMELRASLEIQGLHRDAIQDICDEKRQRLIEEHEASLASPMRHDVRESDSDASQDAAKRTEEQEALQSQQTRDETAGGGEQMAEPGRATEQTNPDQVKESEEDSGHDSDDESDAPHENVEREKELGSERERGKTREREKEKDKEKEKEREREKKGKPEREKEERAREREKEKERPKTKERDKDDRAKKDRLRGDAKKDKERERDRGRGKDDRDKDKKSRALSQSRSRGVSTRGRKGRRRSRSRSRERAKKVRR